jgi:hypothetical protein
VHDGLVSITGGASEEIRLNSRTVEAEIASGALWRRLVHYANANFLMGCGSPPGRDDSANAVDGIVQGHAYALLSVREVDQIVNGRTVSWKLLRLRNPWGENPSVIVSERDTQRSVRQHNRNNNVLEVGTWYIYSRIRVSLC